MPPTSPAEIARIALRRIAELRLAPTPENYERAYYDAAGGAKPEPVSPTEQQLVMRVQDIVAQAATTTGRLSDDLGDKRDDLAASLESLIDKPLADAAEVLQSVMKATREIHATVQASHAELQHTRRSLARSRTS